MAQNRIPTTTVDIDVVAENVQRVRQRIEALGGRQVQIIAVTKGFGLDAARAAMAAGCSAVGENYAQELVAKYGPLDRATLPPLHFIGQLQANKVSLIAPFIAVWQTVDRPRLAASIARHRPQAQIMIQVNATGEPNKGGCAVHEVEALVAAASEQGLRVLGLMTIGPTDADPERTQAAFSSVAALRSRLGLAELSMGMSDDLEIAVPLGATMVRIGRALFGPRPPKNHI